MARRRSLTGFWLSLWAMAGQALLPFVLAMGLAMGLAASGPICSIDRQVPEDQKSLVCPICQALGMAQVFVAPGDVAVPMPSAMAHAMPAIIPPAPRAFLVSPAYRARAPPMMV